MSLAGSLPRSFMSSGQLDKGWAKEWLNMTINKAMGKGGLS